ncbi:hypothetical protein POVWA2_030830 [Plasmodium ovale wallikeri]|uniref:Uncharacterized protein n=1 Tax=Plasmodium ovale wallikeri TaxID=864142 RepID=A0A1A8YYA6_PLAOA|nr:hypothetical protein POVWA2_030830 [Plasmodium ovale wallikeri]
MERLAVRAYTSFRLVKTSKKEACRKNGVSSNRNGKNEEKRKGKKEETSLPFYELSTCQYMKRFATWVVAA